MSMPVLPMSVGEGRFQLTELIGRGGMAAVYLARGSDPDRPLAIKILLDGAASSPRARTRFMREARTTARLVHANIVRVVEVGDHDPPYFIAMEYAAGGTLAQRVQQLGPQPAPEALGWTLQALAGLHHAHVAGVVHRDIKPHNMLLASGGGDEPWRTPGQLKLTDFGVAKWSGHGIVLTGADDALGTMAYMAPEQRADPRQAEPRSDLYGVGATLYLLVTRRRPVDVALAHRDPSVLDRIEPPIRAVVQRATQRDVDLRYPSAREMAAAVAGCWAELDPTVDVAAVMAVFD
jgi:eukaryotic-like serine/threonine-protein kinase